MCDCVKIPSNESTQVRCCYLSPAFVDIILCCCRVKPGPAVVSYDSDDERAYDKEEQPDATSSEYFHDEVDDFHAGREKVMTSLWCDSSVWGTVAQWLERATDDRMVAVSDPSDAASNRVNNMHCAKVMNNDNQTTL